MVLVLIRGEAVGPKVSAEGIRGSVVLTLMLYRAPLLPRATGPLERYSDYDPEGRASPYAKGLDLITLFISIASGLSGSRIVVVVAGLGWTAVPPYRTILANPARRA